jgi:hypothetical protein
LHEVPDNLQAAERSLTSVPIFEKPFVLFFIQKRTSGLRGIISGLAKPEQRTD